MKCLFCGDLHTKHHIFDRVKQLGADYDKVIFLGDYCDDWDTVPDASYNLLKSLIDYKIANPDKVILLLGNHDLSEWQSGVFRCSGFNPLTSNLITPLMHDNWQHFQIACLIDGWLCSHAGFTASWVDKYLPNCDTVEKIINKLQYSYEHRNDDDESERIFYGLSGVGSARGGWDFPSPIWTDANELIEDFLPDVKQIIGHTPMPTISIVNEYGRQFCFCDTHSLFSNRKPFGDNTLLELIDGEPHTKPLD